MNLQYYQIMGSAEKFLVGRSLNIGLDGKLLVLI